MTILNDGSVGIGTLDVSGTGAFTNVDVSTLTSTRRLSLDNGERRFLSSFASPVIYGTGTGGGAYPFTEAGNLVISPRISGAARDIVFMTDSSAIDIAMVIQEEGKVGIGTTTPSAKLHTLSTTEQLRLGYDASNYWSGTVGATGGLTLAGTGTGGALDITPTAGQNVNVNLSGNGIFDIAGRFRTNNNIYNNGGITNIAGLNDVLNVNKHLSADANDSWSTGAAGGTARRAHTSVLYNGKIYSWAGSDGSNLNTVDIYDIAANSWSTGAAGGTARYNHTSVLYNGKIYSWAGNDGSAYINTVDIYDIATDSWSTGAAGGAARGEHTSVLYNGKIYSWAGTTGGYINTVDIYDIAANSWSTGAAGGTARNSHTSVLYNGKIYSWGGYNGSYLNTVDIYDIAADSWSTGAAGGTARNNHTSVLYNGKIHSWAGNNSGGYTNTLDIYDIGNKQTIFALQENGVDTFAFQTGSQLFLSNGRMGIMGGNVGIGTTTPVSTLSIQGSLCVRDTGSCGTTAGTIYATTATIQDIDVAENYATADETLSAGEIVSLDPDNSGFIKRAETATETIIGIISTNPGILLGKEIENAKPVALAGRVPVKVNGDGGVIAIGDRIALSSVAGIGAKATTTGETVGVALESFDGVGEASIEAFIDLRHNTISSQFVIDANGNIGIGTTTPLYKMHIIGDVAANSFINISTQDAKKDITYITDEDKRSILETLEMVGVARYRYKYEDESAPLRLGLIAEEAPLETLSAGGKGVDIYKLATFTLSGVQELAGKVGDLETRIADVEALLAAGGRSGGGGGGSGGGASLQSVIDYLVSVGVKFVNGIMHIANLVVENLTIGSAEKPNGITLYDEVTGEPYCVKIVNGSLTPLPGVCGAAASTAGTDETDGTNETDETDSTDSTAGTDGTDSTNSTNTTTE